MQVRALLAAPGKAAPARANAGALEFRNFDLDGSMFADLGLKADALPLALVTSCEQEAVRMAELIDRRLRRHILHIPP